MFGSYLRYANILILSAIFDLLINQKTNKKKQSSSRIRFLGVARTMAMVANHVNILNFQKKMKLII